MKADKIEHIDFLAEAVLSIKTKDECLKFFEDIFTLNELKSISQRINVAKMLKNGCSYSEIVALTGASSTTVSRVNNSLRYGEGGYYLVLDRIDK